MTAATAEPSVALVLVVNVQTLREKSFSIEMPPFPTTILLLEPLAVRNSKKIPIKKLVWEIGDV